MPDIPRPFVDVPIRAPAYGEPPAVDDAFATEEDRRAAETLVRHLFAHHRHAIDGIDYAVKFALAGGARVGGDIADVYRFDNGNVSFAIADVSGKGSQATVHAALLKFGLRCYASEGLTPERTIRSLDRVFIENNAFERTDQFASVFFAVLDDRRRSLTYANAGHEPVVLLEPDGATIVLEPTAPLVGVFDDQHHLFRQRSVEVRPGSLLVAATDGITEARAADGAFFGMDGLIESVERRRALPATEAATGLLADVQGFARGELQDDVAIVVVRIL